MSDNQNAFRCTLRIVHTAYHQASYQLFLPSLSSFSNLLASIGNCPKIDLDLWVNLSLYIHALLLVELEIIRLHHFDCRPNSGIRGILFRSGPALSDSRDYSSPGSALNEHRIDAAEHPVD